MTKPILFLSYARVDKAPAENLYDELLKAGYLPWMDVRDLLPGEDWGKAILRALKKADFFILLLSKGSVGRRGFLQREIRRALVALDEQLDEDIYFIPARLENCPIPDTLGHLQYVDLFSPNGFTQLLRAIEEGSARRV